MVSGLTHHSQVDWYFAAGLCISDLAGLCDEEELNKLETIHKRLLATGRGGK